MLDMFSVVLGGWVAEEIVFCEIIIGVVNDL